MFGHASIFNLLGLTFMMRQITWQYWTEILKIIYPGLESFADITYTVHFTTMKFTVHLSGLLLCVHLVLISHAWSCEFVILHAVPSKAAVGKIELPLGCFLDHGWASSSQVPLSSVVSIISGAVYDVCKWYDFSRWDIKCF